MIEENNRYYTQEKRNQNQKKPQVRAMITSTAIALIVACGGYTLVHTLTYMITLQFWNDFNFLYIVMYVLEEIPNIYNLIVCSCSFVDQYVPNTLASNPAALQRVLYYWKPIIECEAFVTSVVQTGPVIFGTYVWYFQDGKEDGIIG